MKAKIEEFPEAESRRPLVYDPAASRAARRFPFIKRNAKGHS
jgi:hypothetical protein